MFSEVSVAGSKSGPCPLIRAVTCHLHITGTGEREVVVFGCCLLCCCLVAQLCPTPCNAMDCSMPGLPVLHHLPELAQTQVHWGSDAIQPSHPLLLLLLPSIFPNIRVFPNEWALHIRWPKDWSFSFSISPSNEYSILIPFRIDWLDLLVVQGILKSLLQHHSSKGSILWCSAFFMV